jgi:glycosyltransferase involved in cell wall biosynthesis
MLPTVSVITLTFNHEKYMDECIRSVLNQTIKEWEMIIIDDGSVDRTPNIIQQYDDPRIIYIRKEHRGIERLGESYNYVLERCKGDFVLILEGDDFIPPNRMERQLSSFRNEAVVVSHGKYAYVFGNKIVVYPTPFSRRVLKNEPLGAILRLFMNGFNPIGTQSVMIRKSALMEIGGFKQPPYLPLVDYPTWMLLALKGPFEFIPEVLGYWRRHSRSISLNQNERIFKGFIKYCDEFALSFSQELNRLSLKPTVQSRGAIAYLHLAWICLSEKRWKDATTYGRESWKRRKRMLWSFKMKLTIVMVCAFLRWDITRMLKGLRMILHQQ